MNNRFIFLIVCSILLLGCSTQSVKNDASVASNAIKADEHYIASITAAPDSESVTMAKRFLHSFDAGTLAMGSLKQELERQATTQPAMSELVKKSLETIDADDFENLAARVYTRHLNLNELTDLAKFTESGAGGRFMRISIDQAIKGIPADPNEVMRQFNADELVQLMKFLQSDTFGVLQQKIPVINAELKEESRKLGETLMRVYINKQ